VVDDFTTAFVKVPSTGGRELDREEGTYAVGGRVARCGRGSGRWIRTASGGLEPGKGFREAEAEGHPIWCVNGGKGDRSPGSSDEEARHYGVRPGNERYQERG